MNDIIDNLMGGELFIQIAIPIGYICYFLARVGIGSKDRPVHIIYISLVFSSISVLSWTLSAYLWAWRPYGQIISSVAIPILASFWWRKGLAKLTYGLLSKWNIANDTGYHTILSEITSDISLYFIQIVVYLKNGKVLICDHTYNFKEAHIESYRADANGDIALYVTAIKDSENSPRKEVTDHTAKSEDGSKQYRITYVKESEISRVEFAYFPLAEQ